MNHGGGVADAERALGSLITVFGLAYFVAFAPNQPLAPKFEPVTLRE